MLLNVCFRTIICLWNHVYFFNDSSQYRLPNVAISHLILSDVMIFFCDPLKKTIPQSNRIYISNTQPIYLICLLALAMHLVCGSNVVERKSNIHAHTRCLYVISEAWLRAIRHKSQGFSQYPHRYQHYCIVGNLNAFSSSLIYNLMFWYCSKTTKYQIIQRHVRNIDSDTPNECFFILYWLHHYNTRSLALVRF